MKPIRKKISRAFSLIEMMIVLTVVGVLLAFAAPDLFSLIQSSSLSSEGSYLRNQLTQGQQLALAKNADVEMRFFEMADDSAGEQFEGFRAYQFFQYDKTGEMIAVSRFHRINAPVILSKRLSTILNAQASGTAQDQRSGFISPRSGSAEIPVGNRMQTTNYISFRFRPDGATDLPNRARPDDTWFLTLVQGEGAADSASPDNYYCLQVNPFNGQVTEFRP